MSQEDENKTLTYEIDLATQVSITLPLGDLIKLYDFSKQYSYEPVVKLRSAIESSLLEEIIQPLAHKISLERWNHSG